MKRFVAERNIANFTAALSEEVDPARRALLEKLLTDEKAKLAEARAAERRK